MGRFGNFFFLFYFATIFPTKLFPIIIFYVFVCRAQIRIQMQDYFYLLTKSFQAEENLWKWFKHAWLMCNKCDKFFCSMKIFLMALMRHTEPFQKSTSALGASKLFRSLLHFNIPEDEWRALLNVAQCVRIALAVDFPAVALRMVNIEEIYESVRFIYTWLVFKERQTSELTSKTLSQSATLKCMLHNFKETRRKNY